MYTHTRKQDFQTFVAVLSGSLLSALGVGLFSFTIPLVSMDAHISGAWLGSAFAGYYLAKLIISPISGLAADKYGPRVILSLSMCLGCLIPLAYFISPSLETLYGIQVAMGLISGLIRPVGLASLGSTTDSTHLTRRFALHSALFNGAMFIGPILGSLLYFNRSMTPVLLALAGCMGIAAVVTFFLLPASATTTHAKQPTQTPATSDSRGKAAALFLAIGGRTLGLGLLFAFYPIVLANALGRNSLVVAIAYATPGLVTFLLLLMTGRFSTQRPQFGQIVVGMLLSAGSMFLLGHCSQLWHFLTTGTLMGIGAAVSIPASMVFASTLSSRRGAVFGTAHMASGIGLLLGPLLGGIAVHFFHSPEPAIKIVALLGALSCLPLAAIILREDFHLGNGISRAFTGLAGILLIATMGFSLPPADSVESSDENLYRFTDVAMGTIVNLTLEAQDQQTAAKAAKKTMAAIRMLQQDFDHRNPSGSIGRINSAAGQSWVKPTPRTFALLTRSLEFSKKSRGAFDPTIGALTTSPLYFAMDETIAEAKSDLVDYSLVALDRTDKRVRLKKQGMALDMGGMAKGTIVDAAVALLRKQKIAAGIVEAGGDFYCFGERDWNVGIRHPRSSEVFQTITVREKGVCGSGDYQQFITTRTNGKQDRRHHIINPATMSSAEESIGVTVIADSAEEADVLATTLFIMGPASGTEFLREHSPTSASVWFLPDETVATSDNFPN